MYSEKFKAFIEMWRHDFAIERSIDEQICLDRDGRPIPWYTYPAIEYLRSFAYHDKKIFEYGCGQSALFWAERALSLTTVENNPQWFDKWQQELKAPNLNIMLRTEDEAYENAVWESGQSYDVIAIDGIRRRQCAEAAVKALAPGGMIILDDSDRIATSEDYAAAVETLRQAGLLQVDFYGCCPMNCYAKTTSLFLHRDFDFAAAEGHRPVNGWGNLWGKGRRQRKAFYKKFV